MHDGLAQQLYISYNNLGPMFWQFQHGGLLPSRLRQQLSTEGFHYYCPRCVLWCVWAEYRHVHNLEKGHVAEITAARSVGKQTFGWDYLMKKMALKSLFIVAWKNLWFPWQQLFIFKCWIKHAYHPTLWLMGTFGLTDQTSLGNNMKC